MLKMPLIGLLFLLVADPSSRRPGMKTGLYIFYICGSVHRNSRLKKSNKMQKYANIYLLLNYTLHVSGVHRTHHQEDIKL